MQNSNVNEMICDMSKPYEELNSVSERPQKNNSNFMNDARYSLIGNADEQWSFVYGIRQISRERFNEDDFEPALFDRERFCIYNKNSDGALILFRGEKLQLTAVDVGFIIGYRLSVAKNMHKVSEAMYRCAKKVLSPVCFNEFFLKVDWKKLNFYTLFDIVNS